MRRAHQLAPLVRDGIPARHVVFDTEAAIAATSTGERQSFALAAAAFMRWPPADTREDEAPRLYSTPADLWGDVVDFTRHKHRTIVWAHNLAYDLRVARALTELPALGLALRAIVLGEHATWARFSGGGRSLLCCDLSAFLPTSLKKIAEDLGEHQLALVQRVTGEVELAQRCLGDVAITRCAVSELLHLVGAEHLGPWRHTGAAQSHAAWRRRFLHHRPLVHEDSVALQAERRAMWTGRCEAWRWGKIRAGGVHEYDLQLAYPEIAASERTPHALVGRVVKPSAAQLVRLVRTYAVLAEVDVTTDAPVVPTEQSALIHWPIGTFATTLWDPELRLLAEHGAAIAVRRAWLYSRSPALGAFSSWLLARFRDEGGELTALQRRALKHMARTVIGRCALRYRSWDPFATAAEFALRLGELHDLDTGGATELLHVGHELLTLGELTDADDGLPQITGWVMSEARVRLWRLMEAAGLGNVLYLDTDSLVVDDEGARRLDRLIDAGGAYSLRYVGRYRGAEILGPRQLVLGKLRKIAGVPLSATRTGAYEFEGETWRGLHDSLVAGEGDVVTLTRRRWRLAAVDTRRLHLPGGLTTAHRVG